MSGSVQDHVALVRTLEAYSLAQHACDLCPGITDQEAKSDRLYMELVQKAFDCGWEPGGWHRHLTAFEFAAMRAAGARLTFRNHMKEAGL